MGLPALGAPAFAACTQQPQLVMAPLLEGDAAVLANASDAGKLPVATASTAKSNTSDPPEPTPPTWPHQVSKSCRDDLDAPATPQLPSPFEQCPRRSPTGGQFSAQTTRAERANNPETCCYVTFTGMVVPGRALRGEDARAVVAPVVARDDWRDAGVVVARDACAWLADAALEHASIASFARFALDLLAHGAPLDLVEDAHRAALDEIEHARIAFALGGSAAGPGALDVAPRAPMDLASLARATFEDGCMGETIAAMEARARAADEDDPRVRASLARIAADEERHAELAWRALAWMLRVGGARVREAIRDASQIDARVSRVAEDAMREIVRPCACALLAA
jgi:hypothetical protein